MLFLLTSCVKRFLANLKKRFSSIIFLIEIFFNKNVTSFFVKGKYFTREHCVLRVTSFSPPICIILRLCNIPMCVPVSSDLPVYPKLKSCTLYLVLHPNGKTRFFFNRWGKSVKLMNSNPGGEKPSWTPGSLRTRVPAWIAVLIRAASRLLKF